MSTPSNVLRVVVADDDPDDRAMIREAFARARVANPLHFVNDGDELLDYLRDHDQPGLVLLDLNMPRVSGTEVLEAMRADPQLRSIPVVVLTTSDAEADKRMAYALGANSYICKPVTRAGLITLMERLEEYWFQIVSLPSPS